MAEISSAIISRSSRGVGRLTTSWQGIEGRIELCDLAGLFRSSHCVKRVYEEVYSSTGHACDLLPPYE